MNKLTETYTEKELTDMLESLHETVCIKKCPYDWPGSDGREMGCYDTDCQIIRIMDLLEDLKRGFVISKGE